MKEASEEIRKCITNKERSKRQEKIQRILDEFRGIKNISCKTSAKKRMLIPKVKNDKGDAITSREGIAKVFGDFYSKLYADDGTEGKLQNTLNHETRSDDEEKNNDEDNNVEILVISDEEIQTAINNVKQAEDIRTCDDAAKETIKTDLQRSVKARKWHS